jgi:DMSO reductase anchor subunit
VMAVATVFPAAVLAVGWVLLESVDGLFALAAALATACALLTLYSTGMIYASLRTIRQWHQPLTAPTYVALGLASGAVLLRLLLTVFGELDAWPAWLAIAALVICAALKWAYWLGYKVARKHALKLRKAVLVFAFSVPIACLLLSLVPGAHIIGALLAVLSMGLGLAVERWLFFAEAEHVAMLFYGAEAA